MSDTDLRVLKNILSSKKIALDFVNSNDVDIFSSEVWLFANLLVKYIKKYQEIPTLRSLKETSKKSSAPILENRIDEFWDKVHDIDTKENEFKYDLDKLKEGFAEAEIFRIKKELNSLKPGSVDVNAVLSRFTGAGQTIQEIYNEKLYDSRSVKDYLSTFVSNYNERKNNPELAQGLLTGYSFIDKATNGLKPADMLLIAGESGKGKSMFLQNIAVQVWLNNNKTSLKEFNSGKNIIYFSLEMPYEDCFNRFLAKISGVETKRIESATLTKNEFAKVKDTLSFVKAYPDSFRIVDITEASGNDLQSALIKTGEKYDSIFVDYLGIMNCNTKSDEADWMKQSQISYELRQIARKYKVPLFSAVQLNRKAQKEGSDNIGLSRLARSAGIATHATHVIQIESRPKEEQYPDFIYHLIKNRKGELGNGVAIKNLACASFIDKPADEETHGFEQNNKDLSIDLKATEDLNLDFL